jgi:diguanylate cyclase (GGDEF)-like protein
MEMTQGRNTGTADGDVLAPDGSPHGLAGDVDEGTARGRRELQEAGRLRQVLANKMRELQTALRVARELREANLRLSEDLSKLQQKGEQLRALAYHDDLTGLPNRRLLRDRLHQALAQAIRYERQVALLLLDLDGFKSVNDRLGHGAGDYLLVAVAERLSACVRAADTVCRYGGDEFVIMLPAVERRSMAEAVVAKMQQRLSEPYEIDGVDIRMGASLGVVFYPTDGQTPDELLKRADDALYREKAARGGASITRSSRRGRVASRAGQEPLYEAP